MRIAGSEPLPRNLLAAVAAMLATAATAAWAPAVPTVTEVSLDSDPELGAIVTVVGLPARALRVLQSDDPAAVRDVLAVYTGGVEDLGPDRSSVVGRVSIRAGVARWEPEYRLREGQPYTVVWRSPERNTWTFSLPETAREPTAVVEAVYPDTDTVPENLLRLYIQFSSPMSRGRAAELVELVDESGNPVNGAFVLPEQELWSPAGDRLTLFFDPGRIKRGVGPNLQMGAPLTAGQRITLRVSAQWRDHYGAPLRESHERSWSVVEADRARPDPSAWRLTPPGPSRTEVTLVLAEPLDRPLIERMIVVVDTNDAVIPGVVTVDDDDRRWRFRPDAGWVPGSYALRIDPALEDLAGNSLERLFDEPMRTDAVGGPEAPIRLAFEVSGR